MDIELLLEEKRFVYDPNDFTPRAEEDYHFIVIGAGGTGGYLIPNLGRMIGIKNDEGKNHTVTIVDADETEEKNLLRQNFSPNDIGKNKAAVMATRYGRAFGETFYYQEDYIEDADQIVEIMKSENKTTVIIDCVDNNKTRFVIKEGVRRYHETVGLHNTAIISSGNEEYGGQVVFSYQIAKRFEDSTSYEYKSPDLIDMFPDMNIDQLPSEESCAEQAISAPQNIHTNMTAADIIFGFVNRLLNNIPVDILALFFDSQTMLRTSYSSRNTHVKQLLEMTENNGAISEFLPDEETPKDAIYAPSYEEALASQPAPQEIEELIEVQAQTIRENEAQRVDANEEGITFHSSY